MKFIFGLLLVAVVVAYLSAAEIDPVAAEQEASPAADTKVQLKSKARIQKRGLFHGFHGHGYGVGYGYGYPHFYGGWGYPIGYGWGWGGYGYGYGHPFYF